VFPYLPFIVFEAQNITNEKVCGECNLLKVALPVDGRSEFNSTFHGLWSWSSCLRPWLRSGASCRVPMPRTATTRAVTTMQHLSPCPPPHVVTTSPSKTHSVTSTTEPAPSVPVPQGHSTVSAVAFQVVTVMEEESSVGAGELNVLAPLALRAGATSATVATGATSATVCVPCGAGTYSPAGASACEVHELTVVNHCQAFS
jgi:hypothetical protein